MIQTILLAFLILAATCAAGLPANAQGPGVERLPLWSGRAPEGEGQFELADAWIEIYSPDAPNGTAIVICPGGGYRTLSMAEEGRLIASWLTRHGITGIVLEYRLPHHRPFVPLLDAQRAIRTVRMKAQALRLNPDRIGIMGFSAGGHLAAMAGTRFDRGDPSAADSVERVSSRPDFMMLLYPVVTMGEKTHKGSRTQLLGPTPSAELIALFSAENRVSPDTPPAFIAHARNDRDVPADNSRMFYRALRAANVPAEYLELPSGGHALDGHSGPMWEMWQQRSLSWLASLAPLIAAKR